MLFWDSIISKMSPVASKVSETCFSVLRISKMFVSDF